MAGFSTSNLAQYVDQSGRDIIFAAVAGANWLDSNMIRVVEGVKAGTIVDIHKGSNTLEFQAGNCVTTGSGGTSFDKVQLQTTLFTHFDDNYCGQDLSDKFPQLLRAGADSMVNWPQVITDDIVAQTQNLIGKGYWQANYNSFVTDFNLNGGGIAYRLFRTTASASTYTVNGVGGNPTLAAPFSSSTAVANINALMARRPAALYNVPLEVHMGPAEFEQLRLAYITANYYNFAAEQDPFRFRLIGFTNVTAVCDFGLADSKAIIVLAPDTVAYGCDLLSDQESIAIGYDARLNKTWIRICVAVGAQVIKAGEIGIMNWA